MTRECTDYLVTIGHAMRELGLSRPTIIKRMNEGKLGFTMTEGGHRRVSRRELDRYKETLRPI